MSVHHAACSINFAWAKGCNCNGGQVPSVELDKQLALLLALRLAKQVGTKDSTGQGQPL